MTDYDDLADQLGEHIPYRRGPIAHRTYGSYQAEHDQTLHADWHFRRFSRETTPLEDALLALHGYTLKPGMPSRVLNHYAGSLRQQHFPNHQALQQENEA